MHLATIRIHETEVISLACPRIDAESGQELVDLVDGAARRGAEMVIVDLGPSTLIDFAGARAIRLASARLGTSRSLVLAGLSVRARTMLGSLGVTDRVRLVTWWTDALKPESRAA